MRRARRLRWFEEEFTDAEFWRKLRNRLMRPDDAQWHEDCSRPCRHFINVKRQAAWDEHDFRRHRCTTGERQLPENGEIEPGEAVALLGAAKRANRRG